MSRSMTAERYDLHAVNDLIGVAKRVPLSGFDVWRCDALCTLEELLRILRRLGGDFRRQPKVAIRLCDVDVGIWKDDLSVRSGQAADVVGVEVRDQDDVDFFRRVSCGPEVGYQVPELSPTKPGAGSRIDYDELLAGVDKVAPIGDIQRVRIFVQCLPDTSFRLLSVWPVHIY